MSEQVELLPCICGRPAKIYCDDIGLPDTEQYYVGCDDFDCPWNVGQYDTEAEAVAAWNKRAGEAELAALRARIEIAQSIIQEPFRDYLTEAEWNESKLERLAQAIWGEPVKDDLEASDD